MNGAGTLPPVTTLGEWRTEQLPGLILTREDSQLAARLSGEGRLVVEELRAGLRVSTRSWVGVIRFASMELRIVPKLAGENVGLLSLIDYASGLDCLQRYPSARTLAAPGSNLLDLIALLFAEACERMVRGGLLADYRPQEEDLPVLRGRLLADRQVLRRFGMVDRLECRYDDQVADIPENQVLLAGLAACARGVRHPAVALRVRRLLNVLSEVCSLDGVDLRATRADLSYHRLNAPYREAHNLAWLVLDALGVDDLFARGRQECFAFLVDMNRLFEEFVSRWLAQLLRGSCLHAVAQRRDPSVIWDADRGAPYAQIRPDILICRRDHAQPALPVDAKYKLYDEKGLDTADVYQLFMYASAYGTSSAGLLPTALLLYPASLPSARTVRLHVRAPSGVPNAHLICTGCSAPLK